MFVVTCYSKSCNISIQFTASSKIQEQKKSRVTIYNFNLISLKSSYVSTPCSVSHCVRRYISHV